MVAVGIAVGCAVATGTTCVACCGTGCVACASGVDVVAPFVPLPI